MGAQNLLWGQSVATGPGILQTSLQIAPYGLDHLFVVVQKIGDALQYGSSKIPCCSNSQSAKLICGFAVLGTVQFSAFCDALSRSRFKALTYRGAAWYSRSCRARPLSKQRRTSGTSSSGT